MIVEEFAATASLGGVHVAGRFNPAGESKLRMLLLPAIIKESYGETHCGAFAVVSQNALTTHVWRQLGVPLEANTD